MTRKSRKSGEKDSVADAAEYVDSVMPQQCVTKVTTPNTGSRKRHRTDPDGTRDTISKKPRESTSPEIQFLDRTPANARRSLYTPDQTRNKVRPEPAPRKIIVDKADVHVSATPSIQQLFDKLSSDFHAMYLALFERIDQLETSLDSRISNKVSQLLDKRVNSELTKIKQTVDDKIDAKLDPFRAELVADLTEIREQISSLPKTAPHVHREAPHSALDRSLNVVIRNLPESASESTHSKVNGLIKDGLMISDVTVASAERKTSHNESKAGVIIATFKSKSDKQSIMKVKSHLRKSSQYTNVYINHDLPPAERRASTNFSKIVGALRSSNLAMKGSRIVARDSDNAQFSRNSRDSGRNSSSVRNSRFERHGRSDRSYDGQARDSREYRDDARGNQGYSHRDSASNYNRGRSGGYNRGRNCGSNQGRR